jgi:uncharacterized membrane protein
MRDTLRKWYPAGLLAVAILMSAAAYERLPEQVATHWGIDGEANGWSSRLHAVLFAPGLIAIGWALMRVLPRVDPRRRNYDRFGASYALIVNATLTIPFVMHAATLAMALGWPLPMARVACMGVGLLMVVVGNVLPRARSNFFVGIRTPWTLSSERVWERTHRVGGYLFAAAGLVVLAAAALPPRWSLPVLLAAVGTATLGSAAYSFLLWSRGVR